MKDLMIDENGRFVSEQFAPIHSRSELEFVQYKLRTELKFFLGEYFLNSEKGVDYFGKILKKNPDMNQVSAEIKRALMSVPGVKRLTAFSYAITGRELSVKFSAALSSGDTLSDTVSVEI